MKGNNNCLNRFTVVGIAMALAGVSASAMAVSVGAFTPGDIVVSAGRVATYADSANQGAMGIVKSQAPAEDIDAANFVSDHRIIGLAEI